MVGVSEEVYQQREEQIHQILSENDLLKILEQTAAQYQFRDPAAAVRYTIGEMARDEEQFAHFIRQPHYNGYTPDEIALVTDIYMLRLKRQIDASINRFISPSGTGRNRS
jgi:hypothetical protein